MDTRDICADLVTNANALKAVATVFSDTFTSGSPDDIIRSVKAQTDTFSYLMYVITDYIHTIVTRAEDLENKLYNGEEEKPAGN